MSKLTKAFKAAWYAPGFPARPAPFMTTLAAGALIPAAIAVSPIAIPFAAAAAIGSLAYTMISNPMGNHKEIKAAEQAAAAAEAAKPKQLPLF